MGKKWFIILIAMICLTGCGQQSEEQSESTVDFVELLPQQSEPIIIREPQLEEQTLTEEEETTTTEEETVIPFADRNEVNYSVESAGYEDTLNGNGEVKVEYPQLADMADADLQNRINENIRQMALQGTQEEGLKAYELSYEIATQGSGILSVIFRGYSNYEGTAYPDNIVKTLNLDLTTGNNLRLKDYADIAQIVSGLETTSDYEIVSPDVEMSDFAAFLNNGYVTDYAMTLLDYDADFGNSSLIPAGYSCIRNNHVVLFVETEHAMGDYVEIEFMGEL